MDEAAHPTRHLAVHRHGRVEILDLGGDLHVEAGRVEGGDPRDPGLARQEVRPVGRRVVADGSDGAEAGHDRTAGEVIRGQGSPQRVGASRWIVATLRGRSAELGQHTPMRIAA